MDTNNETDTYAYGYANGYKNGITEMGFYKKALARACEYLEIADTKLDKYIGGGTTNKEQWMEYLLKKAKEEDENNRM